MDAALTRKSRKYVVSFEITDNYVRTYWDPELEREHNVYINPRRVVVTIDPDTGGWTVDVTGKIVGVDKDAVITYRGTDWVDLMSPRTDEGFNKPLVSYFPIVVQAVQTAAREMMPRDAEYWGTA